MEENIGNDNTKMFRRDLKRAKVFAIHYLTRRIRLLRNKRGTEQQIEKNTRKAERFQEEIECIKDLDVNIVLKKIHDRVPDISNITKDGSQDVKERALARLMSSKPIQNRLKDATDKKDISSKPDTIDILSNTKIRRTHNEKQKCKKSKNKIHHPSKKQTITSSDDALIEAFDNSESSDEEIGAERNEEIGAERTLTSFFVESMSSFANDNKRKRSKNEKKTSKETKKASNRLGQRSRQRLWKVRYGYLANHIKSNDNIKRTRKFENVKTDKKKTKQAIKAKPKEATQSHPSWEASKRRKLEQNISQTQFQGKKITFDDSD